MKKYSILNYIRYQEDLKESMPEDKLYQDYTREELIVTFLPLVQIMARKFSTSQQASGILTILDLFQEGGIGLTKAVDRLVWDKMKEENGEWKTQEEIEKTLKAFFSKRIKGQTNFPSRRDVFVGLSAFGIGANPFSAIGIAGLSSAFVKSDLKNKLFVLSRIERGNQLISKKIRRGVKKFFVGGKRRAVVPVSATILTKSPLAKERKDGLVIGNPKNDQEAMKNITSNLDYVRENPENFDRIMVDPNLQAAAPKTYAKSKELAGRALMFLDRKLPRTLSKVLNVNPFFRKTFPSSDQEIYKFKKYLNAVQNPMSIINDLESGNLSTEGVEVMQFVYPELYSEVQSQVFKELEKTGDENRVEYPQRLQLGILMGMPTDMALLPQAIKGLQALYKEAQVSQSGGAITAAAAKQLDLAESEATELEKVSNRKDLNRS